MREREERERSENAEEEGSEKRDSGQDMSQLTLLGYTHMYTCTHTMYIRTHHEQLPHTQAHSHTIYVLRTLTVESNKELQKHSLYCTNR